jgi:hypothetical protein
VLFRLTNPVTIARELAPIGPGFKLCRNRSVVSASKVAIVLAVGNDLTLEMPTIDAVDFPSMWLEVPRCLINFVWVVDAIEKAAPLLAAK